MLHKTSNNYVAVELDVHSVNSPTHIKTNQTLSDHLVQKASDDAYIELISNRRIGKTQYHRTYSILSNIDKLDTVYQDESYLSPVWRAAYLYHTEINLILLNYWYAVRAVELGSRLGLKSEISRQGSGTTEVEGSAGIEEMITYYHGEYKKYLERYTGV